MKKLKYGLKVWHLFRVFVLLFIIALPRVTWAVYCENDPVNSVDPLGLDRSLYINGHAWINVDTYDANGNKNGNVILEYGPSFGSGSDFYFRNPRTFYSLFGKNAVCVAFLQSNATQDQRLLDHWRDLQREDAYPYGLFNWDTCLYLAGVNFDYGMTPPQTPLYIPPAPNDNVQTGPKTYMGNF